MPRFLHLLLDIERLREDEYLFTLDHDGGLVVSMEAVDESGAFEAQLEGLRMLHELKDSNDEAFGKDVHPGEAEFSVLLR